MQRKAKLRYGLYYNAHFISPKRQAEILSWLQTIHPIWENRYSKHNPPPSGQTQRQLLRPVYWLGNWQFACLDYYHPPKGILNRCVKAEPFPKVLQELTTQIESIVHNIFRPQDIPENWHLNTCLVNLYGDKIENGKPIDCARVGEHKDFEPGPVASISLGERALFQFVESSNKDSKNHVHLQQWLDHGSLQIFGGVKWKSQLFHRVQRVDRKTKSTFNLNVQDFNTRRVNFTFRYVPLEHIVRYSELPQHLIEDISPYVQELAQHSSFFNQLLNHS